jgi:small subunit ribosomal protein S18
MAIKQKNRDPRTLLSNVKKQKLMKIKRSLDPSIEFDYKNVQLLRKFVTEYGKLIPRRISGASSRNQRELTRAIKLARLMCLLPYKHLNESR